MMFFEFLRALELYVPGTAYELSKKIQIRLFDVHGKDELGYVKEGLAFLFCFENFWKKNSQKLVTFSSKNRSFANHGMKHTSSYIIIPFSAVLIDKEYELS